MKRFLSCFLIIFLLFCLCLSSCMDLSDLQDHDTDTTKAEETTNEPYNGDYTIPAPRGAAVDLSKIPAFNGTDAFVGLNGNQPTFRAEELAPESYEYYSPLDDLGRCGYTVASVGRDLMPTEERGSIGSVKPSGWQTVKYDCVSGKYLYNRCHLIGYQLTAENDNVQNLITGTRYLNIDGMLPFENLVADYVKETGNHVLYRVEPIFDGANLVAAGVHMEGYSIEDGGEGVCYNVFVYNAQPGIVIDYATGESRLAGDAETTAVTTGETTGQPDYILNTSTKKFHLPDCSYAKSTSEANRREYIGSREDLIGEGYSPCGTCKP